MSWLSDSNAFGRPQRPSPAPQNVTNAYFDANVGFWHGVHHDPDGFALIHIDNAVGREPDEIADMVRLESSA